MVSMMGMEWKRGQEEADIGASIGRDLGTVSGSIGFILAMFMPENGLVAKAMGVECILARMGVGMLASLSGASSTALDTIISEMGTHMLENILRTRRMDLGYIILQMDIDMRVPGMRVEGKGLECTHLEMGKPNLVTGKVEFLTSQAPRTPPIQYLLLVSIILKYSMQCRKLGERQRKPMMWPRWMKGSTGQ